MSYTPGSDLPWPDTADHNDHMEYAFSNLDPVMIHRWAQGDREGVRLRCFYWVAEYGDKRTPLPVIQVPLRFLSFAYSAMTDEFAASRIERLDKMVDIPYTAVYTTKPHVRREQLMIAPRATFILDAPLTERVVREFFRGRHLHSVENSASGKAWVLGYDNRNAIVDARGMSGRVLARADAYVHAGKIYKIFGVRGQHIAPVYKRGQGWGAEALPMHMVGSTRVTPSEYARMQHVVQRLGAGKPELIHDAEHMWDRYIGAYSMPSYVFRDEEQKFVPYHWPQKQHLMTSGDEAMNALWARTVEISDEQYPEDEDDYEE